MLTSVYSGITGMRIHQLWFDVIAGNMANVNTPGYKRSRVAFEDLLNQTLQGAMQPTDKLGGINPMQVGLGANVGIIQVVHTQGTVRQTNVPTDLLINGEGFFVLSDSSGIDKFTRAGSFGFDRAGNLINRSNGFRVLGWNAERDPVTGQLIIDENNRTKIDISKALGGLKLVENDIMSPRVTSKVVFEGNLNSTTKTAYDSVSLNLAKYIKSVVPVSKGGFGINLAQSWDLANFENTPTGKITLGPEGASQAFALGSKPQDLIDAINSNSETTGVSIEYTPDDKFVLKIDPNNLRVKEAGGRIIISEAPAAGKTGFFTEAKIPIGVYNASVDVRFDFDHILDPTNPDNYYLRWKAVNPTTDETIATNAYYYKKDDYGVAPGQVTDELLGFSDGKRLVYEFDSPDVDPTALQVYVTDPVTGEKYLATPYKLPASDKLQDGYAVPDVSADNPRTFFYYYFDDNGQTERINPLTDVGAGGEIDIGKSTNGVDRIIFIRSVKIEKKEDGKLSYAEKYGTPVTGSKITADYIRNGFNMSSSTIDPTTLQIRVEGETKERVSYTFNNNMGVGGKDQVTFFSTVSSEEVVSNSLDISKPFHMAGFNTTTDLVMPESALDSKITIAWGDATVGKQWQSAQLKDYGSVADFLAAVEAGVNGKANANVIKFTYDGVEDRFKLENNQGIYIWQSRIDSTTGKETDALEGFLTHAKLPGEGLGTFHDDPTSATYLPAFTNSKSREEVVADRLDLSKGFPYAGFNNGFRDAEKDQETTITFTWIDAEGNNCSWTAPILQSYNAAGTGILQFIKDVNQAVDSEKGSPLPITLRYDQDTDRFTIVNTNPTVMVSQITLDGFLTKAKLLTTGLEAVPVPVSPTEGGRIATADYNYNKTVEAKGILQLNQERMVINNFQDTESVPEITSSMEVIDGPEAVNLAGNWSQFDSGTVSGTVTITTDSGIYTSKEINISNYPTIQILLNEVNASDARVVMDYDPTTDRFRLKSLTEGARITLEETGTVPFFSEINFSLGTIEGGNNNGVMDLATERPTPEDGWSDTTQAEGTGKDFIRVNVASNEVKGEVLGNAGAGKPGTQVVKHNLGKLDAVDSAIGYWTISLPDADVDRDTVVVYYQIAEDPHIMLSKTQVEFLDNTGVGGEDQLKITPKNDIPAEGNFLYVTYTRLNAFDLKNPDADPTSFILKVNNVIQSSADYTFVNGGGANGVDMVILKKSFGTGKVEADYRQVSPLSSDIFIPNGNQGPEKITFIPNTSVDTTYPGFKTSDLGMPTTAAMNQNYIFNASRTVYDTFGKSWKATFSFEKLGPNRWLWSIINPSDEEKFGGYGIAVFDEKGNYDKEASRIFESPSDERAPGTRFKGILFDPEGVSVGAPAVKITPDFIKFHQYAAATSNASISQDGYETGVLKGRSINTQGVIVGTYTNDQVQELGQIALATFVNNSGLLKESDTLFIETLSSGKASIGKPGVGGKGTIQSGQLEMANVDLVEEFTDLIIAQRAFQANSRIIVTDDQVLTEIVNLKR
ncbi:TPA: hypothetical protein DCX16_05030 [bacterium]|nr:hypothetical protein [bacterium]